MWLFKLTSENDSNMTKEFTMKVWIVTFTMKDYSGNNTGFSEYFTSRAKALSHARNKIERRTGCAMIEKSDVVEGAIHVTGNITCEPCVPFRAYITSRDLK